MINAIEAGEMNARITGLISNKPDIGAIERAQKYDIPSKVVAPSDFSDREEYEQKLLQILEQWQPDLIVLAGYLLKIPTAVIKAYEGKIINIHPSLLPKYGGKGFYGLKVHEAVINASESETGCSMHVVTEDYDEGPVIARRTVPVHPSDTPEELAARVLEQEHKLLPEVVHNFLTDKN